MSNVSFTHCPGVIPQRNHWVQRGNHTKLALVAEEAKQTFHVHVHASRHFGGHFCLAWSTKIQGTQTSEAPIVKVWCGRDGER